MSVLWVRRVPSRMIFGVSLGVGLEVGLGAIDPSLLWRASNMVRGGSMPAGGANPLGHMVSSRCLSVHQSGRLRPDPAQGLPGTDTISPSAGISRSLGPSA